MNSSKTNAGKGNKNRNRRKPRGSRKSGKGQLPDMVNMGSSWPKPRSVTFAPGIGFPDRLEVNLKWVGTFALAGAAPDVQTFQMNSLFDPDLTGGATQPEFFVQLALIYKIYCVLGARAIIRISNLSSTDQVYFVAAFAEFAALGALTTLQLSELKYAKSRTIGTVGGGHDVVNLVMPYMSTAFINGQKEIEADDNLNAAVGANPVDMWFLHCKESSVDGVTASNLYCKIEIVFTAVFKELTNP